MRTYRALGLVALGAALSALGLITGTSSASAAATQAPGTAEITFVGRATDGTKVRITEQLSEIALSKVAQLIPTVAAGSGRDFLSFYAPGGMSENTDPEFDGIDGAPLSAVHLVLADGAVVPARQIAAGGNLLIGTYFFLVPSSTKSATLEVGPGSYLADEYFGPNTSGPTTLTFEPARTLLVVPTPVNPTPVRRTTPTASSPRPSTKPRTSEPITPPIGKTVGLVSPLDLGAGTGAGVVVIVLLVPIWRRRAYRKADADGRVIIDSPPILLSPRLPPAVGIATDDKEQTPEKAIDPNLVEPPDRQAVAVEVIGRSRSMGSYAP